MILIGVGLVLYAIAAFRLAGTAAVAPVLTRVIIVANIQTILLIAAAFVVAAVLNVSFGEFRAAR